MAKNEKYIAVEVEAFGRGMQKLFEGMAEVFSSIGMEEPDRLQAEKRKWQPAEGAGNNDAAEDAGEKSAGTHTDEAGVTEAPDSETHTETPVVEPTDTPAEPVTQKKGRKKTKEPAAPEPSAEEPDFPVDDEPPFDVDVEAADSNAPEDSGETEPTAKAGKQEEASITADDITKIIVQKIKQNRSNNQRIGQLLKTYGVERVSDLPKTKYEAFVTDLAAL